MLEQRGDIDIKVVVCCLAVWRPDCVDDVAGEGTDDYALAHWGEDQREWERSW